MLLIIAGILNGLIWHQNAVEQKETIIYSYILFYSVKVIDCLMKPKFLYWSVKKQTKNLLNQKFSNDWKVKSFEFYCEEMYIWDVEKINKLKVINEKSISPST